MSDLNSHTAIAEQRDALNELQAEVTSPEDQAYLAQVGQELDTAKEELTDARRRQLGHTVLTAEGTLEPADKMQAMLKDGSYQPTAPASGGGRVS